jgi:sugar phosphate isomerase/epimerase
MATNLAETGPQAASGISHFLIQVHGEEREALLDFAIARGHGVDVADFISSRLLDDASRTAELVRWYRERLPRVRGPVSLHGALGDLVPSARDAMVRAATLARLRQCLEIAEGLGVDWVNLHLDFFPLARHPSYLRDWVERQASFWRELAEDRSMVLLLENIWEPRPETVSAAVDAVALDNVAVCLDAAHAHLNSRRAQGAWVAELGGRIRGLHISDNDGTASQHLPPGQGAIDWGDLLGALVSHKLCVPAVIEVPGVAGAEASIAYLGSL